MKNKKHIIDIAKYSISILTIILLTAFYQNSNDDNIASINERFVLATLYSQVAGENKALQLQAFNLATNNIKDFVKNSNLAGNEAIVLDIDETILETSPFQAKMIIENIPFPKGFDDYVNSASCRPIPGALEFLHFIDSLGINIFYVSNRKPDQMLSTMANLKKYKFPQINEQHILLRSTTSSKEQRREIIRKDHKILLLLGDNLSDFSDIFKAESNNARNELVINNKSEFGEKFIVFPNPSYGDWEGLIYNNNWKLSPEEMDKARKEVLKQLYDF